VADDPQPIDEPADQPVEAEATPTGETYGDYARRLAACHLDLADSFATGLRDIRQVFANHLQSPDTPGSVAVPPLDGLFDSIEQAVQRAKLIGSLSAAEALAWDRMQEAGGADDPQAFAEFRAASEFHTALATDAQPGATAPPDHE